MFALLAGSLAAQTFVDGWVVDSLTGAPLSGAYIIVGGVSGEPSPLSDSAGHFRIPSSENQVFITVKRNGYLARSQNIPIVPGQIAPEVRIPLAPQAVISGRVLDENGLRCAAHRSGRAISRSQRSSPTATAGRKLRD
ncbi:MAG: hypothetical protein WDO73_30420 [Ignavibacteriota bacterium]